METAINVPRASSHNKNQRVRLLHVELHPMAFIHWQTWVLEGVLAVVVDNLLHYILTTLLSITNLTRWPLASSTRPHVGALSHLCRPRLVSISPYVDPRTCICIIVSAHLPHPVLYNCTHIIPFTGQLFKHVEPVAILATDRLHQLHQSH